MQSESEILKTEQQTAVEMDLLAGKQQNKEHEWVKLQAQQPAPGGRAAHCKTVVKIQGA